MAIICPWCSSVILGRRSLCPDCGFACGEIAASGSALAAPREASASPILLFLTFFLFALCLSVMLQRLPLGGAQTQEAAAPRYADARMQTTLVQGESAVRTALNAPAYRGFGRSFVQRSAGSVMTLCGTVDGSDGSAALSGTRFLSIGGSRTTTVVEAQTPGFATLWSRLCTAPQGGW